MENMREFQDECGGFKGLSTPNSLHFTHPATIQL